MSSSVKIRRRKWRKSYRNFLRIQDNSFLTHLTSKRGFQSILGSLIIKANHPNSYFLHKVPLQPSLRQKFNVVSFTNIPLCEIDTLTKGPYGLIFRKACLLDRGVFPAKHFNTGTWDLFVHNKRFSWLNPSMSKKSYSRNIRRFERRSRLSEGEILQKIVATEIVKNGYNFKWEKEFKYRGDFKFALDDIIALVVPDPKQFIRSIEKQKEKERKSKKRTDNRKYENLKTKLSIISGKPILTQNIDTFSLYRALKRES